MYSTFTHQTSNGDHATISSGITDNFMVAVLRYIVYKCHPC